MFAHGSVAKTSLRKIESSEINNARTFPKDFRINAVAHNWLRITNAYSLLL